MNEPPPLLPYGTVPPRPIHDTVYTVVLGVLAFLQLIAILTLWWATHLPNKATEATWAIHLVISIQLCFLIFEVTVLLIRILAPKYRKWVTVTLNIILLLSFPVGTIVGVYGLW